MVLSAAQVPALEVTEQCSSFVYLAVKCLTTVRASFQCIFQSAGVETEGATEEQSPKQKLGLPVKNGVTIFRTYLSKTFSFMSAIQLLQGLRMILLLLHQTGTREISRYRENLVGLDAQWLNYL